jgi:hypothetical protein
MQRRQSSAIQSQGQQVSAMQQALARLAQVEAQSKRPGEKPEEQRARAYDVLEKELGLSQGHWRGKCRALLWSFTAVPTPRRLCAPALHML